MRQKCLITGASGTLGRELIRSLAMVYDVTGLCHSHQDHGLHALDIRDRQALSCFLKDLSPDIVIHSAAYRDPDFCEGHPGETRRLNVDPVRCMLEALPDSVRMVLVSSDYVFSGENPPYREDDAVCPVNEYGRSKIEAEALLKDRAGVLIVRPPLLVAAGATLKTSGAIGQMARAVLKKQEIEVDHVFRRFPTWTRDVAEAVKFLLALSCEGVFHVSSLAGGTRYELTMRLASVMGLPSGHILPSDEVIPRKAVRPRDSQLDAEKLQALGFTHLTPYEDVCRHVLKQVGWIRGQ